MTERRYDPTVDEWVTFATHRQDRTYRPPTGFCPLCPTRPGAAETEIPYPDFEVVSFDNRFPSFSGHPPSPSVEASDLYPVEEAAGRCEVVVYSDDHEATFSDLTDERVRMLVDVWVDRWSALGAQPDVDYVMPFENKGEVVGTTLSHPHGQIYGYPDVPPRPLRELRSAQAHRRRTGRCVECDVVTAEVADGRRLVDVDGGWVAWVPFWARFPYEVHVAPRDHQPSLRALDGPGRASLARLLQTVSRSYDALWGFLLPYVMAFHQRPTNDDEAWDAVSHLHVEFSPPHRRFDRLKYLAGSELAGGAFVTDVAPEAAATHLRQARDRVRRAG
ncbi:MAG: galactose-1-phosphate uridylyltransferase [Actinomycetota bacterium]|nr:galactose-1-phosphate uridylyltransferase [Actinomycetota bacterium]